MDDDRRHETMGLSASSCTTISCVEGAADPCFDVAHEMLWQAFGAAGEVETKEVLAWWLARDPFVAVPGGTYIRYFMLLAHDAEGRVQGVRDGSVMVNPDQSEDLCMIYLSHIYLLPSARGTPLTGRLRVAPMDIAVRFLRELGQRQLIPLPKPDFPDRYFGFRLNLVAEMEYFSPEVALSWQRILVYGRAGFSAIDPRHLPYLQPDFRPAMSIPQTGSMPVPLMLLVRRIGREHRKRMPIEETVGMLRMMYDNAATYCSPEAVESTHGVMISRLLRRANRRKNIDLLPLPKDGATLGRLRLFHRNTVLAHHYSSIHAMSQGVDNDPAVHPSINPGYLDDVLESIAQALSLRAASVHHTPQVRR